MENDVKNPFSVQDTSASLLGYKKLSDKKMKVVYFDQTAKY